MKPQRRAPAFQLYADDFLSGTMDMSQEEVGAYIRLLCWQWNRGSIPVDPSVQVRLAGGCVSADVLAKFTLCEDGKLRNERLEQVRVVKEAFIASQSAKGVISAQKRAEAQNRFNHGSTTVQPDHQPNGQPDTQPEPQPKSNSPSPSPIDINKEAKRPTVEQAKAYALEIGLSESDAEAFFDHHEATGWKLKGQPVKSWKACLRTWQRNAVKFGTAKPTNGSHTPKQLNIPSWKLEELLRDQINRHPANWESLKFDRSKVTPEMKADLALLRERLLGCRTGMLQ